MSKVIASVFLLLGLSGCAGYTVTWKSMSACSSAGESSYSCQVERYHAVGR